MRIAITDFHQGWGGQALQALLLADRLQAEGHAVTLFAPPGSDLAARGAERGIPVSIACRFRRGLRPIVWARDLLAFRREIRTRAIEVVHSHGSQDNWVAALATRCFRLPLTLIRTKHNSYPVAPHTANRWLYGRANARIICVAESIRAILLAARVATPERAITLHAGLDDTFGADLQADARESVRTELGLEPTTPLILLVGRLAPDKGQEVAMRALMKIRSAVPTAHLLLVGTGGDYERQQGIRAALDLERAVTFTLFRTDIARLTGASDVALLAATACDASSTVLKEAMHLGIPVVGTEVGGTAEILDAGRCGRLVPPADPEALAEAVIATLAPSDPAALRAQIAAARARVAERYVMSAIARATLEIYRTAATERSGA